MDLIEWLARRSGKLRFLSWKPVKVLLVSWIDYGAAAAFFTAYGDRAVLTEQAFQRIKDAMAAEFTIVVFWMWFALGLFVSKRPKAQSLFDHIRRMNDEKSLPTNNAILLAGAIIGLFGTGLMLFGTLVSGEFFAALCVLVFTWNRYVSVTKAEGRARERLIGVRWLASLGVIAVSMIVCWIAMDWMRSRVLITGFIYFLFQGMWDTAEIILARTRPREEPPLSTPP